MLTLQYTLDSKSTYHTNYYGITTVILSLQIVREFDLESCIGLMGVPIQYGPVEVRVTFKYFAIRPTY